MFTFEALGTVWQISSHNEISHNLREKIDKRIEEFDKNYSRFKGDSLVAKWARKAGEYALPNDARSLFYFYKVLYKATGGLVTPLIGKTMEQAGYDASYSLEPKKVTAPLKWEEAIECNFPKLIVKQPVLLDFGAAGKGYLVDIIAHLLYTNGIDRFCVNAGGDMCMRDFEQTVGLEDPEDVARILGTVKIKEGALCSSGGNRRKWEGYHHIINPQTLNSPQKVKATWVQAENTMLADGIATALFFVSPQILLKTFQFEYAMIKGEDLEYSGDFSAEFFKD